MRRYRARPGGLRSGSAAGFDYDSAAELGGALSVDLWSRDDRGNDADHLADRGALLVCRIQIHVAEPRPGDRFGLAERGIWFICLLPDRLRQRTLHGPPELDA